METCISRRACSDKYNMRLLNDGKVGKYIWTEFRCPNVVSGEAKVCSDCSKKLPKYKYQSSQKCDHGVVGGPYPADSKLYGSPFYLREIKAGFGLLEADENRAKEAVVIAVSKMPRKKALTEVEVGVVELKELPSVAPSMAAPIPKPKKASIKLKAKSSNTVVPVIPPTEYVTTPPVPTIMPTMLESMALQPITVSEVIVVKVRKLRYKGKDYYFDSNSSKLYNALTKETGVGAYAGRYNPETEILDTEYPDSDLEA